MDNDTFLHIKSLYVSVTELIDGDCDAILLIVDRTRSFSESDIAGRNGAIFSTANKIDTVDILEQCISSTVSQEIGE